MFIASTLTPIILTLCFSHIPALSHSIAKFNAVCPPIVGRTASISCFSKISIIDFLVNGFRYILSAVTESVIIVAGLELMRVTSIPSSLSDLDACDPE